MGVRVRPPREADVQRTILDALALMGAVVVRVNSGGLKDATGRLVRFNRTPGCSDILACLRGRFVAVEVKRPGKANAVTPIQQAFLDAVRRAGGVGIVATSAADLESQLEAAGVTTW